MVLSAVNVPVKVMIGISMLTQNVRFEVLAFVDVAGVLDAREGRWIRVDALALTIGVVSE
jgi:hypothetical protein